MKIKEFLSSKEKWTQKACARDIENNPTTIFGSQAFSWCLYGAVVKCYGDVYESHGEVYKKIRLEIKNYIASWNDAPERTFEEVKDLCEKLDI